MAPYSLNMNDIIFETNKIIYVVDIDPMNAGLHRQNAATVYNHVTPFLIKATCMHSDAYQFHLVSCKNHGWVQVGENIANYIMNHNSVINSEPPQRMHFWKKMFIITPVVLVSGLTVYRKFIRK